MPITYQIVQSQMDSENKFYYGRVVATSSLDLNGMADEIVGMGTTVTKTDVLAVLESMCEAVERNLLKGVRINLGGVVDIFTSMRGTFTGPTDSYDPELQSIEAVASAGSRIKKAVREGATVEKQAVTTRLPVLEQYIDNASGTTNTTVTSGGIGTITGSLLQYDETQSDEGIYFVSSGGTATKVTSVERNKASELVFLVPTLGEVQYSLEVRARLNKTGGVKTGVLPYTLTAQPVAARTSGGSGTKSTRSVSSRNGGSRKRSSASTTTNGGRKRSWTSASTSTNSGGTRRSSGRSSSRTGTKKSRRSLVKA